MIKWYNTQKDELPLHGQEVLIEVNGVNYICVYDRAKKIFRTNELLETFFKVNENQILWIDNKQWAKNSGLQKERARIFRGEKKSDGLQAIKSKK
jgi:hypothetical protein